MLMMAVPRPPAWIGSAAADSLASFPGHACVVSQGPPTPPRTGRIEVEAGDPSRLGDTLRILNKAPAFPGIDGDRLPRPAVPAILVADMTECCRQQLADLARMGLWEAVGRAAPDCSASCWRGISLTMAARLALVCRQGHQDLLSPSGSTKGLLCTA